MQSIDISTLPQKAKVLGGIDALYYFYETNSDYINLFLDIIDQIEDGKGRYLKQDIPFNNNDIAVDINGYMFSYGGFKDYYYWLNSIDNLFTFGFKSPDTVRHLNDIQVQINGIGNYTIGLRAVLDHADNVVKGFVTGLRPITRLDCNAFVQADLSCVTTDMFIARQLKRERYRDKQYGRQTQTLYIGDRPFMLRMYDKLAEMKKSKKKEIMEEYFRNHDMSIEEPITNLEFQIHRAYLKRFNIKTVDDALSSVETLFKQSMDAIRLVDLNTLTEQECQSDNRHRASTLPIWDYIKEQYTVKEFLQLNFSLERIKRKISTYTPDKAVKEYLELEHKCNMYGIKLDYWFFEEVKRCKKLEQENAFVS